MPTGEPTIAIKAQRAHPRDANSAHMDASAIGDAPHHAMELGKCFSACRFPSCASSHVDSHFYSGLVGGRLQQLVGSHRDRSDQIVISQEAIERLWMSPPWVMRLPAGSGRRRVIASSTTTSISFAARGTKVTAPGGRSSEYMPGARGCRRWCNSLKGCCDQRTESRR